MAGVWPLTGRDDELAALARGSRGGVVLHGDAGVGKSRLLREALAMSARRGDRTNWVTATATSAGLPLACFAPVLGRGVAGRGDPATLLQRAAASLLDGAPRGRVVLGIDDAHLLDDMSATLVHQLALHRELRMVLTVRRGEPVPDAVTALWKDGVLDRFDVRPLAPADTAALLEAVLGGPVETGSATRLHRVSQGNVLYLQQLVDGERAAGNLRTVGGAWHWPGRPSLRPQLVELVRARFGRLGDEVREVLELLAYATPLDHDVVSALVGPEACDDAERRGLITVRAVGGRFDVEPSHPLYAEVMRAGVSAWRARQLCGRLAVALGDADDPDVLRRAALALDGGVAVDPVLLTRAARTASSYLDVTLAERLARASRSAGGGFEASLLLGYTLTQQRRGSEALEVLAEAHERASHDGERAVATMFRAAGLTWCLQQPAEADEVVVAAIDAATAPAAKAELTGFRATYATYRGAFDLAEDAGRAALADPAASHTAVLCATIGLVGAWGLRGRVGEALALLPAGHVAGERGDIGWAIRLALVHREVQTLCLAGRLADADAAAGRNAELSTADLPVASVLAFLRGQVAIGRGRVAVARGLVGDAVSGLAGRDPTGWTVWSQLVVTQALGMAGDAPAARAALVAAEAGFGPHVRGSEPDLGLARAWVAAAEGAVSEAVAQARSAAAAARAQGRNAVEVHALHTAVVLGDPTAEVRLRELAADVEGPRAGIAAAHATALASEDGVGLTAASIRWEEIGALLLAADAVAQASTVFRRAGRRGSASAAAATAQRLASRCDGAVTPALRSAGRPAPLTGREREIATLAAAGASNREIAERLVLSVRTVEGHLYRACTKLGVTERSALAPLLGYDVITADAP